MTTTSGVSRRRLITGGVAATGAAALAACAPDYRDDLGPGDIIAVRVGRVPIDDPHSGDWGGAPEKVVELGAQQIALPHRPEPVVESIRVRALHDGTTIGFRIDWHDNDTDDLTVRVDDFRDACAVMLAPGDGDETLRTMGTALTAATLLHWKADWQRDVDSGRSGLDTVYPNRSVDMYPPFVDTPPGEVTAADYAAADATEWIPGTHVGNPLATDGRSSPVEKIVANGYSTSTTTPTQDARGRGVRHGDGWRVVVAKPLAASDDGETALSEGGVATCAFAIWSGAAGDAGGRKSPSATVYRLVMDT